jgi:hypothetical protein
MANPEQSVVSAIDELVDESLARPIVDDYSVNRFERCELCGSQWHGLPIYVEERSCPGAWASDEAKSVWRTMFHGPRLAPTTRAGRWTFPDNVMSGTFLDGNIDLRDDTFRVALFQSDIDSEFYSRLNDEVPNGNGYTTGGIRVSLAWTALYDVRVEYVFTFNPVWTATGRGFVARHAVFYDTTTDAVLFHCRLDVNSDVRVSHGNTLTIDNSRPFLIAYRSVDRAES